MERYTEYHDGIAVIKDKQLMKGAMERLAAYEDIGLTPAQLMEVDHLYAELAKEVGQYRKVGTVEKIQEAMEKQEPKKPTRDYYDGEHDCCPNCGRLIYDTYCSSCGQKIDLE